MFYIYVNIIEHTFCKVNDYFAQISVLFFDRRILCDEVILYSLQKKQIMV